MKNIIITGANQGIGYYMVEQLLMEGYQVIVLDLGIKNLEKLKQQYSSLLTYVCDVSKPNQVEKGVKESIKNFGSLDCEIHNACLCTFESMEETTQETYQKVFEVNYFTNAVAYNPFESIYALTWVSVCVVIAAFFIYLFNYKICLKHLAMSNKQKKLLALSLAIFTAPYLFYLPTCWFF